MNNGVDTTIAVVGLGKLGAPLLAVLSQHFKVIGVDTNPEIRAALEDGKCLYYEVDVTARLTEHRAHYRITAQLDEALMAASVIFIVIPTPSTHTGKFDCSQIVKACAQIGYSAALKPHHLIVIVSTVMPGQIETAVIPALQGGGKTIGHDFTLCYNPAFIALGTVVRNILSPDLVLIGESDSAAGERVEKIHSRICTSKPPILRMNFINAEIAKLALNTFVTTKISYANMIARLCEKLPGADSDIVLSSIGVDRRVGSAYFKGAIGYGGPCFPRDNLALMAIATDAEADASLVQSVHEFNERQPDYLYKLITRNISPADAIRMLGVTYKPDTHSIEQSQAWSVLMLLAKHYPDVGFYDPEAIVSPNVQNIKHFPSADACISDSAVVIIGTPWAEFRNISAALNKSAVRCVVDFWNTVQPTSLRKDILLLQLGKGMT